MNYYPENILLQWHITERCNLNCLHCYTENNLDNELSLDQLILVSEKFKTFLKSYNTKNNGLIKAHINITGGEVFVRSDFIEFLEYLYKNKAYFSYAILSNGTLIDQEIALQLKKFDVKFVQVSLDGKESTHDKIRGKGNFVKVTDAIKVLNKAKINTLVSFTAMKSNYKEIEDVAKVSSKLKVTRFWSDRFIPITTCTEQMSEVLSSEETMEYIQTLAKLNKKESNKIFSKTEMACYRALQFLESYTKPYKCSAGKSLITILSDGQVCPCRRMPIKVGNILDNDFKDIYDCSTFKELRDPKNLPSGCNNCDFSGYCSGGLRCLSYAVYQTPYEKDPGCWLSFI